MKTIKNTSALILAMLLVVSANVFAKVPGDFKPPVTYIVTIDPVVNSDGAIYYISVLNENGRVVAHPQIFIDGVWEYTFEEYGPIVGNLRVATMERDSHSDGSIIYNFDPSKLQGPFNLGEVYYFKTLTPQNVLKDESDLSGQVKVR
jgi:hypothetical protein